MYKVLVVDDDKLLREDICGMVRWRQIGFSQPIQCGDGVPALELLKTQAIDLVITDISMPVMNGVELIREGREASPHTLYLVLSNYDDFDYVKEAMRLGALDYLLKYQLEPDSLSKLLREATRRMEECRRTDRTQRKLDEMRSLERNELTRLFLRDLWAGQLTGEAFTGRAEALGMPSSGGVWVPIALVLAAEHISADSDMEIAQALKTAGDELPSGSVTLFCPLDTTHVFLLASLPENSFLLISSLLSTFVHKTIELLSAVALDSFMAGGRVCVRPDELLPAVAELAQVDALLFYSGFGRAVMAPVTRRAATESFPLAELQTLKRMVGVSTSGDITHACDALMEACRKAGTPPAQVKRRCRELALDLSGDGPSDHSLLESNLAAMQRAQTAERLTKALAKTLAAQNETGRLTPQGVRPEIRGAVEYIWVHYMEDVNLGLLAEASGLSRNYFSKMFREEMGMSYPDFLNAVRVHHAKHLLAEGNLRTGEVATAVGYEDYRYFCRVFKQLLGVTCSAYKKQARQGGRP